MMMMVKETSNMAPNICSMDGHQFIYEMYLTVNDGDQWTE